MATAQRKPLMDLGVLAGLVGDEPAVIDEVLVSFCKTAAESRAVLRELVASGCANEVAAVAHQLKGAADTVGALQLGSLCARLERLGAAGRTEELKPALALLLAELDAVVQFIATR